MSMNKVIHAAFRRDLRRFIDALERFPAGDRARAQQLAMAWANFDAQLTQHHEGEHEVVWPALEAVGIDRALIAQMDDEHDRLAEALVAARQAFVAFRGSASAADADAARAAVVTLDAVASQHMDHEEAELESTYLTKRNDPAMKAMERRFRRNSLPVTGTFLAWLSDGATGDELDALRRNVPRPVLAIIGGLFGRRYRRDVAPVWR
jgi:hemerythrin-like domain-containing protein